jgi:hypothetical protein
MSERDSLFTDVEREAWEIGGGSIVIPKPFARGEVLSHASPHEGENGRWHKGNMLVVETGVAPRDVCDLTARANCVMPGCKASVNIRGVLKE